MPGDFAKKTLKKYGVNAHLFEGESRPSSLKQRYKSENKTLIRINHLQDSSINIKLQDKVFKKFEKLISQMDALIFSDFSMAFYPPD